MNLYTVNEWFQKQDVIDNFSSLIWTDRYLGDSDAELLMPLTADSYSKIRPGRFLIHEPVIGYNEVMTIDTVSTDAEEGTLKADCKSLLMWLNNRFVRSSADHAVKTWDVTGKKPDELMAHIVQQMCCPGSPYLNGTIDTGIPGAASLALIGLSVDTPVGVGPTIDYAVPFGPVYDTLAELAKTYSIGMQLYLADSTPTSFSVRFRTYTGVDRSSNQSVRPVVRFSPETDSLGDIKEIYSVGPFKNVVYSFAPENPGGLADDAGYSMRGSTSTSGWDLQAAMIFCDDIGTVPPGTTSATFQNILNSRAHDALMASDYVRVVDGAVLPTNQFAYNVDYFLGDIIEVEGNTGATSPVMVTEYIRSQDQAGEHAYASFVPI